MDVRRPISSVIPSLDGDVLQALSRTSEPLTLSAVRRLAGQGSVSGVRRVLLRLVDHGVVTVTHDRYALNRDHLAAPAIEMLASMYGSLAARIRAEVERWGGDVEFVGMFGSAARRDGDQDSDIDLLVVSDAADVDVFAEALGELVERWTGNRAQVLVRTRGQLRDMRRSSEPIVEHWDRDLTVLVGDPAALRKVA